MSTAVELQCSYSTISSRELMTKVIPDYNIIEPIDCQFWERGSTDTYVIRSAKARYSLRVYRKSTCTLDEIYFEVDALNYLHENSFPVAYPIARKSGGYVTEIAAPEGIRYVLVSAFAEGSEPDYESLEHFRLTGESVAQLHTISDGFKSAHTRAELNLELFTVDQFNSIAPHVAHRPEDLAYLEECIETARKAIEKVGVDSMDYGLCHGDIHGSNAHLCKGVLTHFDFEECGLGFRIFDLATFKWGSVSSEPGAPQWKAFVEGYESVRKIRTADLQLLDTFILLRQIWLISFLMRNAGDFEGYLTSDHFIDHQWKKLKRIRSVGIGIALKKEAGYTVVAGVIDGGPACTSRQVRREIEL